MNVKELIEKLKECDQDKRVILSGYEGGYCDITSLEDMTIVLNRNSEWYYGKHDKPDADEEPDETALLIW